MDGACKASNYRRRSLAPSVPRAGPSHDPIPARPASRLRPLAPGLLPTSAPHFPAVAGAGVARRRGARLRPGGARPRRCAAFLANFDPGGLMFVPAPMRVGEVFAEAPADPMATLLEWAPACDGVGGLRGLRLHHRAGEDFAPRRLAGARLQHVLLGVEARGRGAVARRSRRGRERARPRSPSACSRRRRSTPPRRRRGAQGRADPPRTRRAMDGRDAMLTRLAPDAQVHAPARFPCRAPPRSRLHGRTARSGCARWAAISRRAATSPIPSARSRPPRAAGTTSTFGRAMGPGTPGASASRCGCHREPTSRA